MPCEHVGTDTIVCYSYVYKIKNTKINRSWYFEDHHYCPFFTDVNGNGLRVQPWGGAVGKVAEWIMKHRELFADGHMVSYFGKDNMEFQIERIN